ncbi:hypothetical protein LTR10_001970 [Elasticomyces elasticus]|nr:hypothetical protein LTR10_001970 [Elasticomyces elasticus]KAK4969184.1 hypothetical protein LTR42_009463 [Elasticomyces elasticus]
MAANQVLLLPELLEHILLDLTSMRDLLFAQKVCRTWKATIDTSPGIQKALYLTAGGVADVIQDGPEAYREGMKLDCIFNPLLMDCCGYYHSKLVREAAHISAGRMLVIQPPRQASVEFDIKELSDVPRAPSVLLRKLSDGDHKGRRDVFGFGAGV